MPGRNDPCPCGSGKKYKRCCLAAEKELERQLAREADERRGRREVLDAALDWLERHCRAALARALEDSLGPRREGLSRLERPDAQAVINEVLSTELFDGTLETGAGEVRLRDLVLGPGGPPLDDEQGRWLRRATATPARLWRVVEVVRAEGVTLEELLAGEPEPLRVWSPRASTILAPGELVVARLVRGDDRWEAVRIVTLPGEAVHAARSRIAESLGHAVPRGEAEELRVSRLLFETWLDAVLST